MGQCDLGALLLLASDSEKLDEALLRLAHKLAGQLAQVLFAKICSDEVGACRMPAEALCFGTRLLFNLCGIVAYVKFPTARASCRNQWHCRLPVEFVHCRSMLHRRGSNPAVVSQQMQPSTVDVRSSSQVAVGNRIMADIMPQHVLQQLKRRQLTELNSWGVAPSTNDGNSFVGSLDDTSLVGPLTAFIGGRPARLTREQSVDWRASSGSSSVTSGRNVLSRHTSWNPSRFQTASTKDSAGLEVPSSGSNAQAIAGGGGGAGSVPLGVAGAAGAPLQPVPESARVSLEDCEADQRTSASVLVHARAGESSSSNGSNALPAGVAATGAGQIAAGSQLIAKQWHPCVTVLYADIVGFTTFSKEVRQRRCCLVHASSSPQRLLPITQLCPYLAHSILVAALTTQHGFVVYIPPTILFSISLYTVYSVREDTQLIQCHVPWVDRWSRMP